MQRILTTADVIAAIPGLIGFVPAESMSSSVSPSTSAVSRSA